MQVDEVVPVRGKIIRRGVNHEKKVKRHNLIKMYETDVP